MCECLTQNASVEAPAPPPEPSFPPLFFLKAEKSFCQPDLLLVVIGGAEAVDGVLDGVQVIYLGVLSTARVWTDLSKSVK